MNSPAGFTSAWARRGNHAAARRADPPRTVGRGASATSRCPRGAAAVCGMSAPRSPQRTQSLAGQKRSCASDVTGSSIPKLLRHAHLSSDTESPVWTTVRLRVATTKIPGGPAPNPKRSGTGARQASTEWRLAIDNRRFSAVSATGSRSGKPPTSVSTRRPVGLGHTSRLPRRLPGSVARTTVCSLPMPLRRSQPRSGELPTVERDGGVLTVTLPPVNLNHDTSDEYIAHAFPAIRDESDVATCGWIVDIPGSRAGRRLFLWLIWVRSSPDSRPSRCRTRTELSRRLRVRCRWVVAVERSSSRGRLRRRRRARPATPRPHRAESPGSR